MGSSAEATRNLLATPTKRQRVRNETTPGEGNEVEESPSVEEIWGWTMTADAIATCFVKDVIEMKQNLLGGADFYWLGRVPCRTVRLVGLVVGVQVYESRILYSIDDGTAVIDCSHRVQRPPWTPTKKARNTSSVLGEMPKPMTRVGRAVKIIGKIHTVFSVRQIQVDEIEVCKSTNEEPLHWLKVRELHRTNYGLKEPFVIPSPSPPDAAKVIEPFTPSTVASTRASSVVSSPLKPGPTCSSPPKLRHPSRLHSRDLGENTFRIYVKHYMIYAPNANDDTGSDGDPTTPTKSRSNQSSTPRPTNAKTKGFTLSYLRRVPELADMARRVVLSEAKRRSREERRKENEERSRSRKAPSAHDFPKDKLGRKMKRLFEWVVVQMLQEGSIILWDGPMRCCSEEGHAETSRLWKTSTSISIVDSNVFSASCAASRDVVPDTIEDMSDPNAEEEGYMPVTPAFLADYVEKALRVQPIGGKPDSKLGVTQGATKEEILGRLHKDDRWQYIGEWQVQDALEFLQSESRAWTVGKERWELTG